MKLIIAAAITMLIAVHAAQATPAHIDNQVQAQTKQPTTEVVQLPITSEAPTPASETVPVQPQEPTPQEKPVVTPVEPETRPPQVGCEQYRSLVSQYDWNVNVAMKVMEAESTVWIDGVRMPCYKDAVNDTPATRDYSIGLFQINLYGANARNRPSEEALKDPATNVAWAYKLYSGNGKSFIGQWGVCRSLVACY